MTIEKFVDTASIDPVYYDSAYFLVPDGEAGKDVYAVLRDAIAKTGKTALLRVVIAQRERTIALRPMGEGDDDLVLRFDDEQDAVLYADQLQLLADQVNDKTAVQYLAMSDIITAIQNDRFVQDFTRED